MPDRGARYADRSIVKVTRSLKKTYAQAQKELEGKLKDFNARFKAKDKEKRAQRDNGEITEQQYKDWLSGQVFIRNQWESKIRQVNAVMLDYNKQAMNIVNNSRFDVFAENYYSEAFRAQWIVNDLSWNVYNSQALAQLIKDDPQILPEWKIDEEKDYKWNYKKVNNIIKQGIIQGESVEQITKRLCTDLSSMNENKMRMFARTGITEAQNAGRQEQMRQAAEDLDIEQEKEWQATYDNRTRDAHRHLDGDRVPYDQSFTSDLGEIMFPGDPTADPANVFNCRCTIKTIYPKYEDRSKNFREDVTIDGLSYMAWKTEHDIKGVKQSRSLKEELENEPIISKNPTDHEKDERAINRFGEQIDYSKIEDRKEQISIIENLANEFDTKLKEVHLGAHRAGGTTQISGTIMNLSDKSVISAVHEFAHTISLKDQTKFGLYDESEFWKEIKAVHRKYLKDVGDDTVRWVSSYEHSSRDIDEFFAEAFTQIYLKENGIDFGDRYGKDYTYSMQVMEITRKYFGKKQFDAVQTYSGTTLQMYDEALGWAKDSYGYKMEELREGWKNVSEQLQAFNEFEKEIPNFENSIREAIEKNEFSSRTNENAIINILKDGRMKSQMETKTSGAVLDIERRKRATEQLFAGSEPLDLADSDYEIYGYIDNAPRAKMYGNIRIAFSKERLLGRTTVTCGDSLELLETGADPMATRATDPKIYSYGDIFSRSIPNAKQQLEEASRNFKSIREKGYMEDGNYVELQFHGGVTLEDIDYIELSRSLANADEIEKLAKEKGVKIKWLK